jgi:hypothetical protein
MQGLIGRARVALCVAVGFALWSAAPAAATTFHVTNLDDAGAGSLRQAIIAGNNDSVAPTTIDFAPSLTGVLALTSSGLSITHDMTIDGPGAGVIELDGQGQLQILTVSSGITVSISGLRFAFGHAPDSGGAIRNLGTLTVTDDVFDHNTAGGAGSATLGKGGAIGSSGTLTVSDSTFTDNAAGGAGAAGGSTGIGLGGAIYNGTSDSLTVAGSTFAGNTAGGAGAGGQLSGAGAGGAIAADANSTVSLTDSTLTANTVGGSAGAGTFSGQGVGGGLAIGSGATATLQSDTIDANATGPSSSSLGGGIQNQGSASIVATVVSGNSGGGGNCNNTNAGAVSARDSLEGPAGQSSCNFDLPSADPALGPLVNNGGPTETQALRAGSSAIGAVASAADCPGFDQRGVGRPRGGCDVGAYEYAPPSLGAPAQAVSVGTSTATLVGFVVNEDRLAGSVMFQYGTTPAYGSSTAPAALPAMSLPFTDSAPLSGLAPGTVYHYRVVATNPDGTVYGPDQQFTTGSLPPPTAAQTTAHAPVNKFSFGKAIVASGGKITLPVKAPGAGRFVAKATFTVRLKHRLVTIAYGTGKVTSGGAGTFKLVIGLSARAAHELKLLGRRQVTITVTFTPTAGTGRLETKRLTVKRNHKGRYS